MVHLTLVGMSEDRTRLLLVNDAGEEFTLDADASLRSALRGMDLRPGQLEIDMDSALRPRDIQARIRAGETPEEVAHAAGTSVEKVMPYAAPVLAERAHVAERAQLSSVRRRSGEGSASLAGGRTLGEAISAHLRELNIDPETVEWDACRREDGRWALTGAFSAPGRSGTATFSFDLRGNYVTVDDEDARWLIGEAPARPAHAATKPTAEGKQDPGGSPRRRLSAVPAEQLPLGGDHAQELGDDALELVAEEPEVAARALHPDHDATLDLSEALPVEAFLDDDEPAPEAKAEDVPGDETDSGSDDSGSDSDQPSATEHTEEPKPKAEPRRPTRKSRGRASVPSWDEIMFGGGGGD